MLQMRAGMEKLILQSVPVHKLDLRHLSTTATWIATQSQSQLS